MLPDEPGLAGRRVLLTGGTGFLGRSLLDHLLGIRAADGDAGQVDVLTRFPSAFLDRFPRYRDSVGLTFLQGSLDELPRLGGPYSDIIHAAGETHRQDGRIGWFKGIVSGTEQALDLAVRTGVKRFLFVSSGAVYGRQAEGRASWREEASSAPSTTDIDTSYAQAKRAAEHLCALYTAEHGFDVVIARCFALLSEHIPLDGAYAAGNFIRDAVSDAADAIRIDGDGETIRTYLSGRDMAHWMFSLLRNGVAGEAYNVGSDEPVTLRALAELVRDTLAPGKAVRVGGGATSALRSSYIPDIGKARGLGLRMQQSLPDLVAEVGAAIRARQTA